MTEIPEMLSTEQDPISPLASYRQAPSESTPSQDPTQNPTTSLNDKKEEPITPAHEEEIPSDTNQSQLQDMKTTSVTPSFSLFEIPDLKTLASQLQDMQRSYKEDYSPVPYEGKDPDAHYFFLSLEVYQTIVDKMSQIHTIILEKMGKSDLNFVEKWKQGIESILFKALIAESVKYGQWIAEEIAQTNVSKDNLDILELCTGAGITTCMTYLERLNTNPRGRTRIVSVDNSIESVSCASLMASSFGIPTKVCTPDSLSTVDINFNGIVFVIDDVTRFSQQTDTSIKFDSIISDNGISYFPEQTHKETLEKLQNKFPNSTFYISSLKNGKSVKLGLPFKISGILKGSNFSIKEGDEQYLEKDGVIVETYTPETKAFFQLANAMLKNGFQGIRHVKKLLGILSSATKSTQDLNSEISSPVSTTEKISDSIGLKEVHTFPSSTNAPCKVGVFKSKTR